jgi:flagellar basal body-associated protein FliL
MSLRRQLCIGLLSVLAATLNAAPAAVAKAQDKGKGVETTTTVIEMEALTVNIFRSNYGRGKVEVIMSLDVPNSSLRERALQSMPRLRAAYVQTLTRIMYDLPPRTPPNIGMLSESLQQATNQVLGRPGAKVLLGSVVVN